MAGQTESQVAAPAGETIEADTATADDEGFETDRVSTATMSISSSVRDHVFENNRRYHKYMEGRYLIPNDNPEQEREDMKHALRILDVGTGTGIWAIDMADEYPGAEVTGIDLSPIQPSWIPSNVKFIVDDVETDWVYPPGSLDYVHLRNMVLALKDVPGLLARAYKALKPGGWIELQDFLYIVHSDDGSIPDDYRYTEFTKLLREGFIKFGFDVHAQQKSETHLKDAGFVGIRSAKYKVPIGPWPRDKNYKKAGLYNKAIILDFFPNAVAPFTRRLGWTIEQYEAFLVGVRTSINDSKVHAYYTFHMTIRQKPE